MSRINRQSATKRRSRRTAIGVSLVILSAWMMAAAVSGPPVSDPFWWLEESKSSIRDMDDRREQLLPFGLLVESMADVNRVVAVAKAKTGDSSGAIECFRQALDAAAKISDTEHQNQAYLRIAADQVRVGEVRRAEFTARQIAETSRSRVYATIVQTQLELNDIRGALETAENPALHGRSAHYAYLAIAVAQAKAGDTEGANASLAHALSADRRDAWERMEDFCAVAEAQMCRGDLDAALQTAQQTETMPFQLAKARAMAAVAVARASLGDQNIAAGLFNKAIAIVSSHRLEPSMTGDLKRQVETLQDIAWARRVTGDTEGSEETLRLSLEAIASITDSSSRDRLLGEVTKARAEAGDIPGAIACARAHEVEQDQAKSLKDIVQIQLTSKDLAGAAETIQLIESESERENARLDLIDNRLKAKDFAGAMRASTEMDSPGGSTTANRRILEAQAAAGDFDNATTSAGLIPLPLQRAEAFLWLGHAAADSRQAERERAAYQSAAQAAMTLNDTPQRASVLRNIAQALAEVGDVEGAMQTIAGLRMPGDDVYRSIALAQVSVGDLRAAQDTSTHMKKNSQAADDVALAIAGSLAAAGNLESAFDTAAAIKSTTTRVKAYQAIASEQSAKGDEVTALKAAQIAIEIGDDRSALNWAHSIESRAALASGDIRSAYLAASRIADNWLRREAYEQVVRQYVQHHDVHTALRLAEEFERDIKNRDALYQVIALEQMRQGDYEGALATAGTQVMPPIKADPIYEEMAREYAITGRLDEALDAASHIRIADRRAAFCRELGASLASTISVESAMELARRIESDSVRDAVLTAIADSAAKRGDATGAQAAALAIGNATTKENTILSNVAVLAGDRHVDLALEIVPMLTFGDNGFLATVDVQVASGDLPGAINTTKQMRGKIKREEAYQKVALAQIRARDFAGALEVASNIGLKPRRDEIYWGVLSGLMEANEFDRASSVIDQISSSQLRDQALKDLAAARMARGETEAAREAASQINRSSLKTTVLQNAAITDAVHGELPDTTSALFQHLLHVAPEGRGGVHYAEVFAALASQDLDRAESHLDDIESDIGTVARARVLCAAIRHSSESDDPQVLGALIDQAGEAAASIEQPAKRFEATHNFIAALAATRRFALALETASQLNDSDQRELARATIATAQADAGRIDAAIATVKLIKNDHMPLARAWQAIAKAQAGAGQAAAAQDSFAAAVKASHGSIDAGITREWLHGIVQARIECGDFDGAVQDALSNFESRQPAYFKTIGRAAVQSGKTPQLLVLIRSTRDPTLKAALQAGAAIGAAYANAGIVPSTGP